jgi:transposase
MMGTKERNFQPLPEDISLEDLVPEDNFYRRLQQKLDLSFVRELVEDLYAASGRPSVDPEVFFRLQLVMFYEGIRSERELMRIVSDRLSVRWYVGYDLHKPLPDHSSLTRIRDRFGLSVFREFFERIVQLCIEAGLVLGEQLYFDATKVDANASLDSIAPRFFVEEHLGEVFTIEEPPNAEQEDNVSTASERGEADGQAVGAFLGFIRQSLRLPRLLLGDRSLFQVLSYFRMKRQIASPTGQQNMEGSRSLYLCTNCTSCQKRQPITAIHCEWNKNKMSPTDCSARKNTALRIRII